MNPVPFFNFSGTGGSEILTFPFKTYTIFEKQVCLKKQTLNLQ